MAEAYRAKPEGCGADPEAWALWTFDDVEARLVEAIGFLRRMPGGGSSPYAKDGPWAQIRREWGDYVDRDEVRERESRPRGSLRTEEVDRMEEALDWVRFVRAVDTRLLGLALASMERDGSEVPWTELAPRIGLRTATGRLLGPDALRMRYQRAVGAIAKSLNMAENRA
jgi:hypothetical protein